MQLTVNGQDQEHQDNDTLFTLLTDLDANPKHSALTVNGDLVLSKDWKNFTLHDRDIVEILTFVGGG